MTTDIAELAQRCDDIFAARSKLKKTRRIGAIFNQLDHLDASIAALERRAAETRLESQCANRDRNRCSNARGRNTPRSRQSNKTTAAYQRVMERLHAARAKRLDCEAQLNVDEQWRQASDEYYQARHALLLAIAEREKSDKEWLARKQSYLCAAGLELDSKQAWHDATSMAPPVINLYYGGVGEPDGVGHGHVILERDMSGIYGITWHRPAVKEALVFS